MSIYAVSISASQGKYGPHVMGHLIFSEEGRKTAVDISWELPHAIQAGGSPIEWLYSVLSRVVQDFDDHTINRVEFDAIEAMKRDAR